MRMRQRKTRLDKKKGSKPTPQARQRIVLSYHLIGRTRGWVKAQIQTSHKEVLLTITQSEIKANIKRDFLGCRDHLEGKKRRASKIILKLSLKQLQR
jgi:hypothetical protein